MIILPKVLSTELVIELTRGGSAHIVSTAFSPVFVLRATYK